MNQSPGTRIRLFTATDMVTGERLLFVITCCTERVRDFSPPMMLGIRTLMPGALSVNISD